MLVVELTADQGDPAASVQAVVLQLADEQWVRFALAGSELRWGKVTNREPQPTSRQSALGSRVDWIKGGHVARVWLEKVAPDAAGLFISFAEGKILALMNTGGRARLGVRDDVA